MARVSFEFKKGDLIWVSLVVVLLCVGFGVAQWDNTKAMFHDASDVKITIDGEGDMSLQNASDLGLIGGGGWNLIYSDDFESIPSGWDSNTLYDCDGHSILGRKTGTACFVRTFSDLPSHVEVAVKVDYFVIDSWDNRKAYIEFDNKQIWSTNYGMGGLLSCGSGTWSDRIEPNIWTSWYHTGSTLTLEICAALNNNINDESFGIDNIEVYVL